MFHKGGPSSPVLYRTVVGHWEEEQIRDGILKQHRCSAKDGILGERNRCTVDDELIIIWSSGAVRTFFKALLFNLMVFWTPFCAQGTSSPTPAPVSGATEMDFLQQWILVQLILVFSLLEATKNETTLGSMFLPTRTTWSWQTRVHPVLLFLLRSAKGHSWGAWQECGWAAAKE